MIDYRERVDEVVGIVRDGFGVDDRQAVEALLASRLECKLPYPWIVLETDWFSTVTKDAWFAFGDGVGPDRPIVLSVYRTAWPRDANIEIETVLAEREKARLFIEPEYQRRTLPSYKAYLYRHLQRNAIHIRSAYPRRGLVEPHWYGRLKQAMDRAIDNRFRSSEPKMPVPPPGLLYWAELAQKLALDLDDWTVLLRNLYGLAGRRAYLYDRSDTDADDWRLVMRALHDSIPQTTTDVVLALDAHAGRWSALKPRYTESIVRTEIHRLRERHVVHAWQNRWKIEMRDDVIALLSGSAALD